MKTATIFERGLGGVPARPERIRLVPRRRRLFSGRAGLGALRPAGARAGRACGRAGGTPWRALVHVRDLCLAFRSALEAPRDLVHNEAFNVGRTTENYRVREVAEMVEAAVPGSKLTYAEGGGPDPRCYRVDCGKLESTLPMYQPQWTVAKGVAELVAAFERYGFTADDFNGDRYFRIRRIQKLQREGLLDESMRWIVSPLAATTA